MMSLASRAVAILNDKYRKVLNNMRQQNWAEQVRPLVTIASRIPSAAVHRSRAAAGFALRALSRKVGGRRTSRDGDQFLFAVTVGEPEVLAWLRRHQARRDAFGERANIIARCFLEARPPAVDALVKS